MIVSINIIINADTLNQKENPLLLKNYSNGEGKDIPFARCVLGIINNDFNERN